MNQLEKIIIACMSSVLITGCTLPRTLTIVPTKPEPRYSVNYSQSALLYRQEQEEDIQGTIDYLNFFNKSGYKDQELLKSLEEKDLKQFQDRFFDLVNALENDSDPALKEYLQRLKDFTYQVRKRNKVMEVSPYKAEEKEVKQSR